MKKTNKTNIFLGILFILLLIQISTVYGQVPPTIPCTPEICNDGIDNDCDGFPDGFDSDCQKYCDRDGDGFYSKIITDCSVESCIGCSDTMGNDCEDDPMISRCSEAISGCSCPADRIPASEINPSYTEFCDGYDNNCNGIIDEGCDDDNDGWCDATLFTFYCSDKLDDACINTYNALVIDSSDLVVRDCDDDDADIHPPNLDEGAYTDKCENVDNDCDGFIDEGCENADAHLTIFDSDNIQVVGPLTIPEIYCETLTSSPADTTETVCKFPIASETALKKDDTYRVEIEWGGAVDNSVTLTIDHDSSEEACACFYAKACDAGPCWINPGENEIEPSCCGDDEGETFIQSLDGSRACCDNLDDASAAFPPSKEECALGGMCMDYFVADTEICGDGIDNNCNGEVEEFCGCDSASSICEEDSSCPGYSCKDAYGNPMPCWDIGGDSPGGANACCEDGETEEYYIFNPDDGTDACCDNKDADNNPLGGSECVLSGICLNKVAESELAAGCDGIDNDCDGLVDEDYDADHDGFSTCAGDAGHDDDPSIHPGAPEICDNGIDENLDGQDTKCGTESEVAYYNLCRLVYNTLYIITYIVGAGVFIFLVIGGLRLIASENPDDLSSAKQSIRNILLGTIVFMGFILVSNMLSPLCTPIPGSAYLPPMRAQPNPTPIVNITVPEKFAYYPVGNAVPYQFTVALGTSGYTYIIDYGDGSPTSTGEIPLPTEYSPAESHTYAAPGEYSVYVKIIDSQGEEAWDRETILIGKLEATIEEPTTGYYTVKENPITFSASVIGGQGPYTYTWMADGGVFYEQSINSKTFTYVAPANTIEYGKHKIKLIITDSAGISDYEVIDLTVTPENPSITNTQSCWGRVGGYFSDKRSYIEFDVTPESNLKDTKVKVTQLQQDVGSTTKFIVHLIKNPESQTIDMGDLTSGTAYTWTAPSDRFPKSGSIYEIEVSAELVSSGKRYTWKYCAACEGSEDVQDDDCPASGLLDCWDFYDISSVGEIKLGPCPPQVWFCDKGYSLTEDSSRCFQESIDMIDKDAFWRCDETEEGETVCWYQLNRITAY